MSTSSHVPRNSASAQSAFAADELWKFQLRRENRALLERVNTIEKAFAAKDVEFETRLQTLRDEFNQLAAEMGHLQQSSFGQEQFRELQEMLQAYKTRNISSTSDTIASRG